MTSKLSEKTKLVIGVYNADISTADRTGSYQDVSGYKQVRAHLFTGNTVADTKTVFVQLLQAQDSSGTGAKALTTAVTTTASGSQLLEAVTEAATSELDSANGFTHIAVKVGGDGTSTIGYAVLELGEPTYLPVS